MTEHQEPALVEEEPSIVNDSTSVADATGSPDSIGTQKKKMAKKLSLSSEDKKKLLEMDNDAFLDAMEGNGMQSLDLQDVDIASPKTVSVDQRARSDVSAASSAAPSLSASSTSSGSTDDGDQEQHQEGSSASNASSSPTSIVDALYHARVPITEHGLLIMLKPISTESVVIFDGYAKQPDGHAGPAEVLQLFKNKGDVVIAINDCQIKGLTFPTILKLLKNYIKNKDNTEEGSMIKFQMMDYTKMPPPKEEPEPEPSSLIYDSTSGSPINFAALKQRLSDLATKPAEFASQMEQYAKHHEFDFTNTVKKKDANRMSKSLSNMKLHLSKKKEELQTLRSPDVTKGFEKLGNRMKLFTSTKFQSKKTNTQEHEESVVDFTSSDINTANTNSSAKKQLADTFHTLNLEEHQQGKVKHQNEDNLL